MPEYFRAQSTGHLHRLHPACVCVIAGKKYTVQESNPAHTFRGGKTVGSAQVSEDGFEEFNVIGVMTQSYAEKVGGSVEHGEPSIVLAA